MRGLFIIPLLIATVAAIGCGLCAMLGLAPQPRAMILAAVAVLAAAESGFVPVALARGGSQASIAQAGLIGTLVHLMVAAIFAAIVLLNHAVTGQAFVYWLLAFYWTSLLALVVAFTRQVRLTGVHPSESKQ